jgi:hypothetical protein
MDFRDQSESKAREVKVNQAQVSVAEYPTERLKNGASRTITSQAREASSPSHDSKRAIGPNWSGNIMWTFAFGEREISRMAGSMFSCGRQAWLLLNQMSDLCKTRHQRVLKSSSLLILLASELRAIAVDCPEARFALELRVIKGTDGLPDLELMDNGMWRKPMLRVSTKSQPGAVMLGMGD